jgi:V-type H+-transporting ATPase subunit a
MKMKISVIVGVLHMTMGIVVKGLNNWNNRIVFYFEVIAGLFILLGLFGWMDVLIITKWLYPMNPYSVNPTMVARINAAPSIISIMINNFLLMGRQPFTNTTHSDIDIYMFENHRELSETFVGLVIFVIPFMLCVKPCSLLLCPKFSGLAHHEKVAPENPNETNNNIEPTDNGNTYHTEMNLITLNDAKEFEEIELPPSTDEKKVIESD